MPIIFAGKMAESKITESDVFTAAVSSSAARAFLVISITIVSWVFCVVTTVVKDYLRRHHT